VHGLSAAGSSRLIGCGARGGLWGDLPAPTPELGLLANITRVGGTEIPMFVLASDVGSLLASGISVMILAGIYTTAVPLR
jgi:uncharacterized membrane protein YkvI